MTERAKIDIPIQHEVFPDRIKLRRIDPTKNMRRFYLISEDVKASSFHDGWLFADTSQAEFMRQ